MAVSPITKALANKQKKPTPIQNSPFASSLSKATGGNNTPQMRNAVFTKDMPAPQITNALFTKGMPMPQMTNFNSGIPQMPQMNNGLPQLSQMNPLQQQGAMSLMNPNTLTIDDFGKKFGLNYSRDYADRQAKVIQDAKTRGYNNQLQQIESGVNSAVNSIDRDYFQDMLRQQQSQVNSGLNSGIAADQDLRLAMNRQNAMGDIYRGAQDQSSLIQDNLAALEAEALAYADELYNTRREQGYQNTQNYNQLQQQNAGAYADYLRNITNDNRNYAIMQGELMGNYIPYEAQSLIQTVLNAKDQLAKTNNPAQQQALLSASNQARIQLASMGVDVDQIGETSTFNNALNSISSMNKTMAGQQNDMDLANQVAAQTGKFTDPRAQQIFQTLLQLKKQAAERGSTQAERIQANELRAQLDSMGIDSSIIGKNVGYSEAIKNAAGLGITTQAAQLQAADIRQRDAQILNERTAIDNEYRLGSQGNRYDYLLGQAANENERLSIDNNYELTKEQLEIERTLNANNYSLEEMKIDLQGAAVIMDAYAQSEAQSGVSEDQMKAATDEVIASLLPMTKSEIIMEFAENHKNWIENGVDVVEVMETLGITGLLQEGEESSSDASPSSILDSVGK